MLDPRLLLNRLVSFSYPRHNYRGVPGYREKRRVAVDKIRIVAEEPLATLTSERNPLLLRGSVLIIGMDLDKLERRSFYLESCEELEIEGGDDFTVAWIITSDSWLPGKPLPDMFDIDGALVSGVSAIMAGVIADAGNAFQVKHSQRGRWLIVIESAVLDKLEIES